MSYKFPSSRQRRHGAWVRFCYTPLLLGALSCVVPVEPAGGMSSTQDAQVDSGRRPQTPSEDAGSRAEASGEASAPSRPDALATEDVERGIDDATTASDAPAADVNVPPRPGPVAAVCDQLPPGPFQLTKVPKIAPIEDLTFDDAGNLYWGREGGGIMKTTAAGTTTLHAPSIEAWAGLRWTKSGDLYAETEQGIERISADGSRKLVFSGVSSLNCMEVDPAGRVYATEFNGMRVFRYDPMVDKTTTLTSSIKVPNGLSFNPAFNLLYVGTYHETGESIVYQIPINADGTPGETKPWLTGLGSGVFDGMGVDECGNVYISDTGANGKILRISPDGKRQTVIIDRPGEVLHNFIWGRGNGWSETKLYIVSLGEGVYEADLGVRSKKYW